jgi:hypothetical protein
MSGQSSVQTAGLSPHGPWPHRQAWDMELLMGPSGLLPFAWDWKTVLGRLPETGAPGSGSAM